LSSNIVDYVRVRQNSDRQDINKILAELQDLNAQDPEDAALQERIALWASRRKRTSSIGRSGAIDQSSAAGPRDRRTEEVTMEMPTICTSYPLIDTLTGTFTFPAGVETGGTKFGGKGVTDGSSYITIDDDAFIDLTTDITIALYFKPKASSGNAILLQKDGAYELRIQNTNTIAWFVNGKTPVTYDYTADIDNWIAVVATYKSTGSGQKLYIDGISQDTDSETGAITTNANDLKTMGDGTEDLPVNSATSWIMLLGTEEDSTWITNHNLGHFDFSGGELKFFIPMTGNAEVFGEATSNYCVSS